MIIWKKIFTSTSLFISKLTKKQHWQLVVPSGQGQRVWRGGPILIMPSSLVSSFAVLTLIPKMLHVMIPCESAPVLSFISFTDDSKYWPPLLLTYKIIHANDASNEPATRKNTFYLALSVLIINPSDLMLEAPARMVFLK